MERIGGETMALYGDLRERLEAFEAVRSIASLPGQFTTKLVKDHIYHYFQAMLPGGRRQIYLGPDSPEIRRLITARQASEEEVRADEEMAQRLAAQVMAGGVSPIQSDMARVITRLADSGVFRVGGVLVGTVAFKILGTHLGVSWKGLTQTQDVDLASDDRVAIAVPNLKADVPAAIESLRMGFFPVPRLSLKEPSTSYAIRGKTLRVDLLTPARRRSTAPVFIRRLNAAAAPFRYLDYLIEGSISAVMLAGSPCLVKVPQPGRFALHKLIVSQERDPTFAGKKEKDLLQAGSVLALLREDRPGDIQLAWEALAKRGSNWVEKVKAACVEGKIPMPVL